jgi:hypothetical protein
MKRDRRRAIWLLAIVTMTCAAPATADVPPRSASGQTLALPEALAERGEVFHILPGEGTQLIWQGQTDFVRSTGLSQRIVGFFVAPFERTAADPSLLGGAWRMPVVSIVTGDPGDDEQITGAAGLDAANNPEVTFELTGVDAVALVDESDGRRHYTMNVTGQLNIKGNAIDVTAPATVHFLPFTWQTMPVALGDLCIVKTRFEVTPAQMGLPAPRRPNPDMIPERHVLDLHLIASTSPPDLHLDPRYPRARHHRRLAVLTQLRDFQNAERGGALAQALVQEAWDDAAALGDFATMIAQERGLVERDLDLALKAADRACALTDHTDAALLDTRAAVLYEQGELAAALEAVRLAADHLAGQPPEVQQAVQAHLAQYEAEAAGADESPPAE